MKRLLIGLTILATVGMFAVTASADPPAGGPPGQGECDHGNSGQDCVPDPNENGQDCEEHGNEGGVNEDHCVPSPTPPSPTPTDPTPTPTDPTPTPTEPTTPPNPTPPAPVACPGHVSHGPWYGDPRINLTLTGEGSFVVRGGIQRFSGLRVIRATLDCGEVFAVNRYKVKQGGGVHVYMDGSLVLSLRAPRTR